MQGCGKEGMMRKSGFPGAAAVAGTLLILVLTGLKASLVQAAGPQAAGIVAVAGMEDLSVLVDRVAPAVVDIAGRRVRAPNKVDSPDLMTPRRLDAPRGAEGQPVEDRIVRERDPLRSQGTDSVRSIGTGFIIDPAGWIVTNLHVVQESDELIVTLRDGRRLSIVSVVGDEPSDLALIKVATVAGESLPAVHFGDSATVKVGQRLITIGNPFGFAGTVTSGIVSGLGRVTEDNDVMELIQHEAALNLGSSGGPAFNMAGEVIGINSAIFTPTGGSVGLSFAIPSNQAKKVITQLRERGRVEAGWLGVRTQGVSPELAEALGLTVQGGVIVVQLAADGPVARAGVKLGDVITGFGSKAIRGDRDLLRLAYHAAPGAKTEMILARGKEVVKVVVAVGRTPERDPFATTVAGEGKQTPTARLGLELAALTPEFRERFGVPAAVNGVVVAGIDPEGPAAAEGVHRGDVVVLIGRREASSPDKAEALLGEARKAGQVTVALLIDRRGERQYLALHLGGL
ncbi:Periplasmic serine endoprotease DegP-like [uncultured Gammaproteobacteria bacterium]